MAIQISGTTVVDNSRNLTNIESFATFVKSIWSTIVVYTTAGGSIMQNRNFLIGTSGAKTRSFVLPANPTVGMEVVTGIVADTTTLTELYTVSASTATPTGQVPIMGLPSGESLIVDLPYAVLKFTYVGGTIGWSIN